MLRADEADSALTARGSHTARLLASELRVLFGRWRTWTMLAALAAVPVVIGLAVRFGPGRPTGRGPAFLDQVTDNGLFAGVVGLVVCTPLFLPLTVSVVSGDAVAGEASLGTLRYLLAAPVGRVRLLVVKYLSAAVFSAAAGLAIVLGGALVGVLLFPLGKATLLSGTQIGAGESLARLLLMALYVTISLPGMAAIGLFASTLTTVPVGAMAATAVLAVVAQILGALDQLDWLHPWLFTDHWLGLADFLRDPISWDSFGANAWVQLGYIAFFGALAYGRFTTKDILA
ncbi:ABC transporter permease [Sinomonas notoginsengisoli]|uniref:ABC transporter permease n=1 Tax=Sinomonas notoginsengisoli TaxID=1457311 RepID=UPI001F16197F|nr:ABC transporter permease [Sinomonas notoginsengisoli]